MPNERCQQPVDLIYRFDPGQPPKDPPRDAGEARRVLESGNRKFARWLDSCQDDRETAKEVPSLVISCGAADLGLLLPEGAVGKQSPFAVLLGCSDARVPAEMIFGAVRNNLFVVRVAGNTLSSDSLGSIDYAVDHIGSLQIAVVLGHTGCGAVAAAVDSYLDPWSHLGRTANPALRSLVERLLIPVRTAAQALARSAGDDASRKPGYREALVETAELVNAMYTAYGLSLELARAGKQAMPVLYGVFDLAIHRIRTAPPASIKSTLMEVILADAPASLQEFEELAMRVASRAARRLDSAP